MRPRKSQKLDLNEAYPCPCRRRGRIVPIALTEAFGCDRCQQIFVVRDQNYVIEQLASHYPYKRAWRWNGHQWLIDREAFRRNYVLMMSVAVFVLFVCLFLLATAKPPANASATLRVIVALLIPMALLVMFWSASRR